jgi:hypothetical protein
MIWGRIRTRVGIGVGVDIMIWVRIRVGVGIGIRIRVRISTVLLLALASASVSVWGLGLRLGTASEFPQNYLRIASELPQMLRPSELPQKNPLQSPKTAHVSMNRFFHNPPQSWQGAMYWPAKTPAGFIKSSVLLD